MFTGLRNVLILALIASLTPVLARSQLAARGKQYAPLDAQAEPLRSAFNTDSGKVRAILLASPT